MSFEHPGAALPSENIEGQKAVNPAGLSNQELAEAVGYLREQAAQVQSLQGECEYIVRSVKVPDRRLSFADQRLDRQILASARRSRSWGHLAVGQELQL